MTPEMLAIVVPATGALISGLLAGNIWFIKQLVNSIKANTEKTSKLELQMAGVMGRLDGVAAIARDYPKLETKVEVLAERVKSLRFAQETPTRR